ncbi:MAG: YceD family protein, partial [Flavobacteriales bacterium]
MNKLKEYRIPYLGLKAGNHRYEFHLTNEFFDSFEFSEIQGAGLQVEVDLEKQSTMIVIHTRLSGGVQSECDHCGDPLSLTISTDQQLVVKFGNETSEQDDDILILGPNEHEIDLAQYLYEYAHLALPARRVHASEADCNQHTLQQLAK